MGLWAALIDRVAGMLAYFPPKPPTYTITSSEGGKYTLSGGFTRDLSRCKVMKLDTERRRGGGGGEKIVAIYVPYDTGNGVGAKKTLLHSHGNAVDLGIMQSVYVHLSETLGVNVLGYDYSGYGRSTGSPSIRNTFADIRACWSYLVDDRKVNPKDIILYGQSVGSGPTCELASKVEELGGVILHSPLASGMRVLKPTIEKWPVWLDIYPNLEFVQKIKAPTLIMHGTADEVIHISNATLLHSLCGNSVSPLWVEGYDHQNLDFSPQYVERLGHFMQEISMS
ncbi:alpha/beta-hydrolase [Chloropicon primus]|uniref:Alpha/beta-hydrolase n=1 Tax=Chloropicon primus TaxID=1764295 RepID=A0A5B8MP69_9CHLO|nr:alpha/beta-hydrolase [Chloropicon primus]UPR00600.1 alpha/beta-hydrolase [Chloropicon primus]|eukprot:QDZ21385.1 alpha/beta-hydrolase [Chloropicon primus]